MGGIIKKIAVIGAGLMGHGIAQEFSAAGYEVALNDVSNQRLGLALGHVRENLGSLGFAKEDVNRIAARIQTSADLPAVLLDADLVVEAVPEDLEVKRTVFTKIDQLLPTHSIIASNTSFRFICSVSWRFWSRWRFSSRGDICCWLYSLQPYFWDRKWAKGYAPVA